jgi:hypothetical protein
VRHRVTEPTCTYPSCDEPAAGSRGLIATPEPIMVVLCEAHLAIVDSNQATPDTRDFWRWFDAVSGYAG